MNLPRHKPGSGSGFTLIEMLLALAVSAIVLAGIGGVFFSAMRLRERTTALVDASAPLYFAMDALRRDLQGALPPGAVLAGAFKSGPQSSGGLAQSFWIQFSTTTGAISASAPYGDIQDVLYELREPEVRTNGSGKDLVRGTCRNLLSTMAMEWTDKPVLANVESLQFSCFDGVQWRDTWDTSMSDTNLPSAVRVRIQLVGNDTTDNRIREPIEIIVPLVIQSGTNETQSATAEGSS